MICTEADSGHYGLGFMVSPRWKENIHKLWRVNDRISVLQLQTEKSKQKKLEGNEYRSKIVGNKLIISKNEPVDHMINIINVYAPTSEKVEKNPKEVEDMYLQIEKLMTTFKKQQSSITMIAGDFNAKVGKKSNEERCIGNHTMGKRNKSGQRLIEFCERNEMYISNTSFEQPTRHKTTWSQQRIEKKKNEVKNVFNQIDYILIKENKKHSLRKARSYAGTETFSDHRLVVAEIEGDWTKMFMKINKSKQKPKKRINIRKLINDEETRKEFGVKLDERIEKLEKWEEISEACLITAEEVLGFEEKGDEGKVKDEKITELSRKQKELRLKMMNEKGPDKLEKMRKERKGTLKETVRRVKEIREKEIDEICEEIDKTKDDARMFKAAKKIQRKPFENPIVHDKEGKCVTQPQQLYQVIKEHFHKQFFKEDQEDVQRFIGPPRPLNRPISSTEVSKAASAMSNGKAANGIPVEIIKYGSTKLHNKISATLNNLFSKHQDINTGASKLIPLQKPPPKKKGPVKNLRPINLLPIIRKVLSKVGLKRAEGEINGQLSQTQSAYRTGRSTTDIVWAYRWILAKVQEYDITMYVTGIDMSSAFDTMERNKLLEYTESFLDEDNQRILRVLLSDTSVEIQVKGAKTEPFKSNIGGPQGDSYSGPQFTTYFERSLKNLRTETGITMTEQFPEEIIYADDYDNITDNINKKKVFKEKAKGILGRDSLGVNEDKTEDTILKRGKHDRKNKQTNEPWRDTIKLGSKLGDKEDIARRKQLARVKMVEMKKILKRKNVVRQEKKLKLYNALVKSVLTYNSGTWGLTKEDERNLDSFHRQNLRQVIGVQYPKKIGKRELYETTKTRNLSIDITKARWKMFGHALRMNENTPARKAMKWYFQTAEGCKKFRGRKRATLVTTLNRDILRTQQHNTNFRLPYMETELDLRNIRVKALNRSHWQKIVCMVTDAAYSDSVYN